MTKYGMGTAVCHSCLVCVLLPCLCVLGLLQLFQPRRFRKPGAEFKSVRVRDVRTQSPSDPQWPKSRERPIMPPLGIRGDVHKIPFVWQKSWFFTEIPLEIRRRVYDFALGESVVLMRYADGKGRLAQCYEPERGQCLEELGKSDPGNYRKRYLDGSEDMKLKIAIDLLCTCQQVYCEAIDSLYTTNTFLISDMHQVRPSMNYTSIPPTLLHLPWFVLAPRLQQIRTLCIHWHVGSSLELGFGFNTNGPFWACHGGPPQVSEAWRHCWMVLAYMQGLHELFVRFDCEPEQKWGWLSLESELIEHVREVKVKKRFVVVLPFRESNVGLDVGQSKCELRLPDDVMRLRMKEVEI